MANKEMNLHQKILKIADMAGVLQKTKEGYGYKYVPEEDIQAKVTAGLQKYGVMLYDSIIPGTFKVQPIHYEKWDPKIKEQYIIADSAEPKTIHFYALEGFKMVPCHKFEGSRLANTKKVKRFKRIICSTNCPNARRELSTLTYAKDKKTDRLIPDEFNIDPHTFSAIWYALDNYFVADVKQIPSHSKKGGAA